MRASGRILRPPSGERAAFAPSLTDSDGYDAAFFALEPGNYWSEARNPLLVWALRRYFLVGWRSSSRRPQNAPGCRAIFILPRAAL